ncbi:hypothetical protein BH20ACT18_BH20ACT18_01080 [soil metagenome]
MSELSLEIVEGPGAGRQVPLGEPLVVGRAPDVQVVLEDPQVSRRHARISPRGERAIVEDLGSSDGTFVNGSELHALRTSSTVTPTRTSSPPPTAAGVVLVLLIYFATR